MLSEASGAAIVIENDNQFSPAENGGLTLGFGVCVVSANRVLVIVRLAGKEGIGRGVVLIGVGLRRRVWS